MKFLPQLYPVMNQRYQQSISNFLSSLIICSRKYVQIC